MIDWAEFKCQGKAQVGKQYIYGASADPKCDSPVAFDCAELVYWLFGRIKVKVPNYSEAIYKASLQNIDPTWGDVGFFKKKDQPTHHCGLWWGKFVLEARGEPFNKVILRPIEKWENWKEFTGWRRPIALIKVERD